MGDSPGEVAGLSPDKAGGPDPKKECLENPFSSVSHCDLQLSIEKWFRLVEYWGGGGATLLPAQTEHIKSFCHVKEPEANTAAM